MKMNNKMFVVQQIDEILVRNLRSKVFRDVGKKSIGGKFIVNTFHERLNVPITRLDTCLNDELFKK